MPQFAANLSMLYPECSFLDRFEAAAKDGFKAVEFLFPYDHPVAELKAAGLDWLRIQPAPGCAAGGYLGWAGLVE